MHSQTRVLFALFVLPLGALHPVTGSDLRADEPQVHVRASQVGYPLRGPKLGVAFGKAPLEEAFTVADAGTGTPVFEGNARPIGGAKWGPWTHFAELDFSAVAQSGTYELRIQGTRSIAFKVGADVFDALPDTLLEYMRQQRCGFNQMPNSKNSLRAGTRKDWNVAGKPRNRTPSA